MDLHNFGLVFWFFLLILEVIIGTLTNAFIVVVLLLGYFKKQTMNESDKILIALSITNICSSLVSSAAIMILFMWPWIYSHSNATFCIFSLTIFGTISMVWLTACLCVFYFVKILNFSSGILLWAKMKISNFVPWLIFFSELVSLCWTFFTMLPLVTKEQSSGNISSLHSVNATSDTNTIIFELICTAVSLPLMIIIITTFSTTGSLYLHRRRMEKNLGASSSLKAHQSVVWMMIRLLLLYTLVFVVQILHFSGTVAPLSFEYCLNYFILFSIPVAQSVLLIQGNPKLKDKLKQISLVCTTADGTK
ncbi:hypothetical protein XENTR_v10023618 [Xenopus tropicalis]|uniref:Taste receptor type 2 n=1 Tax=Xenopus tropicalis TaxID=8364 RepID=Q2AB48_XENTR|nr:bitter taste receptor 37 [Xenopus tropicalis]KAE8578520.1 hypothetical protein XENTR_v10023618 [Xenopus tropicalis]BAE80419.1 bitter taste receptor [Xenopus tropicalis]|eukprot:NP_001165494.1 bitter taste receptor 37 [Xenopus tropicalis]